MRQFLDAASLPSDANARGWLAYLAGIKTALGNINNDLGFVATSLVKRHLKQRFCIVD